ncbi:F-box/WD repeat-containing protein 9-like isoform X4 [Periplaneta americana]|uniref:F-box/WD repeat-containing protein 9-like isoform X4 n=2 Tax=Periplaneta americana TaxID=6978 RepID=UPI0037E8CED0
MPLDCLPSNSAMCDFPMTGDSDASVEKWSLENIPVEIFLHICSYLDARFITHSLSVVCKRFHEILSDAAIWKSRITKRWGSVYPPIPVDSDDFNWRLACVCIEDQYEFWQRKDANMRSILRNDIHYASVDAIHLMDSGLVCVSGSRDRSIVVWDLTKAHSGGTDISYHITADAHKGWIWKLASCGETIYSCSWDTTIKSWKLMPNLQPLSVFQCRTAALSLVCTANLVAAGTFLKSVMLFDTRVGECQISSYTAHRRAVLALSMSGNFIVSASEDQTLAVWDQRAGKVLKQLKLYENNEEENAFPMCVSFNNDLLYVGDTKGRLHLLNPVHGHFNIVESYEVGHTAKLTCVQHGMGSILTSSTDGTVRISTPTQRPENIAVVSSQGGEVTGFDYKNNVLAVGGTDNAVEVWLPCYKSVEEEM